MQIRMLVAAGLLSCSGFAQETPARWKFSLVKPFAQAAAPQQPVANRSTAPGAEETAKTCSIPLTKLTPPSSDTKMPSFNPAAESGARYTMKLVPPPAPACEDVADVNRRTPETRP